jgi:hypothetical protein
MEKKRNRMNFDQVDQTDEKRQTENDPKPTPIRHQRNSALRLGRGAPPLRSGGFGFA